MCYFLCMTTKQQEKRQSGPGKSYRNGISLIQLTKLFPDEEAARQWFEAERWPDGPVCPKCQSTAIAECKDHKPQPYRCKTCRKHFSVRTDTVLARSHVPLQKWVFALYLYVTSLKGVSSMRLHRDLDVTQKTAWFMAHRIRKALESEGALFAGPIEVDEAYLGGREKNKHASKKTKAGRGPVGKAAVVGLKDRETNKVSAQVVEHTNQATLQAFVNARRADGAKVYTDEHGGYVGLDNHESVKHSVGEYVKDQAHTNGIESFWASLKRGYTGTYHKMSVKHLDRYVNEFAGRHNLREADTLDQMAHVAAGCVGQRLLYQDLIAA